jgi:hypothetical protein
MTSLICSGGGLAAAMALAAPIAACRTGKRIDETAVTSERRRSAKGCR